MAAPANRPTAEDQKEFLIRALLILREVRGKLRSPVGPGGPPAPSLDERTRAGLAEALWGSTGVAHSVAECRTYFERAGARDVTVHEFVAGVLTRVTGRRPG